MTESFTCQHCQRGGFRRHEIFCFNGYGAICQRCGRDFNYQYVGLDQFHQPKYRIVSQPR